jgi:hypothetical protein
MRMGIAMAFRILGGEFQRERFDRIPTLGSFPLMWAF